MLVLTLTQMATFAESIGTRNFHFVLATIPALIIGIFTIVFMIWMLVDVIGRPKPVLNKILWAILIIGGGLIGSLIYYFIGRKSTKAI